MNCKNCKRDITDGIKENTKHGWKCPLCYTINPYHEMCGVIWKTPTGTPKRMPRGPKCL